MSSSRISDPESRDREVDLNADLGEGFPWDEALLDRVTSASVCCGAHAGDEATSRATLVAARERGVVVGAHPGYADRPHFGRRDHAISDAEVAALVSRQVEALRDLARDVGVVVRFVKPHGALYNQAQRDDQIARGVVAGVASLGLPILGQPHSRIEAEARRAGLRFVAEGFVDRRYDPDGRLVPRDQPGAILNDADEIRSQVVRLIAQGVEILCLHGDNPESVRLADLVREALHGVRVRIRSPF